MQPASYALHDWIRPRLPTLRMIGVGTLSWTIAIAAAWRFWPAVTPLTEPVDRVLLAVELLVPVAAFLFLSVLTCMRLLDTAEAENPLLGAESARWKINARVLQNSVEQAAIFAPTLLGLAVRIDPVHTKLLPILTTLWVVGRVLFWIGFHVSLPARAVGFDWTYYTAALGLVWFASTFF